jgi:hypothetical protein
MLSLLSAPLEIGIFLSVVIEGGFIKIGLMPKRGRNAGKQAQDE